MKILITGGAGFIGSAVVRQYIGETPYRVVNLDKPTYAGYLDALGQAGESSRYHFEQVDNCNRPALERVFAEHRPDAVMHLAAESHVDRSISDPADFIETNNVGTTHFPSRPRLAWGCREPRCAPVTVPDLCVRGACGAAISEEIGI